MLNIKFLGPKITGIYCPVATPTLNPWFTDQFPVGHCNSDTATLNNYPQSTGILWSYTRSKDVKILYMWGWLAKDDPHKGKCLLDIAINLPLYFILSFGTSVNVIWAMSVCYGISGSSLLCQLHVHAIEKVSCKKFRISNNCYFINAIPYTYKGKKIFGRL